MSAHAKLSPSGSKRWMSCPGSLVLEAKYPNTSTKYSDDGSAMHEVAAACLTDGFKPEAFIGDAIKIGETTVRFTQEMAELVEGYVDLINEIRGDDVLMVEQRVNFSPFVNEPDQFGTCDVVIVRADELDITDLKTGRTPVKVEKNSQLMTYALGVLHELAKEEDDGVSDLL